MKICSMSSMAYRLSFYLSLFDFVRDRIFVGLPQGEAERAEGLEQLRALEHGHGIQVAVVEGWRGLSVDVPADVSRVEAALRGR